MCLAKFFWRWCEWSLRRYTWRSHSLTLCSSENSSISYGWTRGRACRSILATSRRSSLIFSAFVRRLRRRLRRWSCFYRLPLLLSLWWLLFLWKRAPSRWTRLLLYFSRMKFSNGRIEFRVQMATRLWWWLKMVMAEDEGAKDHKIGGLDPNQGTTAR